MTRKRKYSGMARKRFTLTIIQKNLCFYCTCKMTDKHVSKNHKNATIEHLLRKCEGGTNEISNLAAACSRCNLHRGEFSVEDWKLLCKPIIKLRLQKDDIIRNSHAATKQWKLRHNIRTPDECKSNPTLRWLFYIRKTVLAPKIKRNYRIMEKDLVQSILQTELKMAA